MATIPESLLASYQAATYRVNLASGPHDLRVGQVHPTFDQLLNEHGATCWAFLTAWNPGSQPLSDAENATRQERLLAELQACGYRHFAGIGLGGDWQEESLLVLGMTRDLATEVGRRWGQLAIVWGAVGQPAELVWCHERP